MFIVELDHGLYIASKSAPFKNRVENFKYAEKMDYEQAKAVKLSVGGYKEGYGEIYCSIHEVCEDMDGVMYIRQAG